MKILFNLVLALGIMVALGSCKGHSHEHEDSAKETVDKSSQEYASAYVCPMHCKGSGSAEAGKCPVCGMDYVANTEHNADAHDHEGEEGDDHDHDGEDGDDHDHDGEDGDSHEGHDHD